jgi:ubiquinone/menaquinone biosynthesis C-methylase UbiE
MTDWARDYFEHAYPQRWALDGPSAGTHAEVVGLCERLGLHPEAALLDVACGHGRYAVALAQRGACVTGLDFSDALLERAHRLAAAMSVRVDWIRADMRALPLRAAHFRAALLLDALGFFEPEWENHLVMREIARVLAPGGRVALKVVNAEPILAAFRPEDREEHGGTVIHVRRELLSGPPRLLETIAIAGPRGSETYQRRQRLYRVPEIRAMFETVGLTVIAILATTTGVPFHPTAASTIIGIAERPARAA